MPGEGSSVGLGVVVVVVVGVVAGGVLLALRSGGGEVICCRCVKRSAGKYGHLPVTD
jgi:hypothetical protein